MVWQDVVIGACQLAIIPAMIPSIVGKDKPALTTSAMNAGIVYIITFCLFSLELWFASATALPIAVIWTILAFQKRKINRATKP